MRWVAVKNGTSETIPGFAVMALDDSGDTVEKREGQAVFVVRKPNSDDESANNRSLLFINGPVPIKASSYGVATQDYPCQVLHDSTDTISVGDPIGCKNDSWYAWAGYGAWTFMGVDKTLAINGGGSDANAESVWVMPGVGFKPLVHFTLAAALTTSDASKAATVVDQFGLGADQVTTASGITVHNKRTSAGASTYLFEGGSGDYGFAIWDKGTDYVIIQMECP